LQTLTNYVHGDATSAFSGPLVRGDVATVRKHLQELKKVPEAREVYVALAKAAVKSLPVRDRKALRAELRRAARVGSMKDSMGIVGDIMPPANEEKEWEVLLE
jgi:predicted short-subunit dehydrogenase-like oxidoreductase (DUF2520 family)